MVYNPQNAKEEPSLPPDVVFEGAIIDVKPGLVKDFVTNLAKWRNPEQTCIEITMQVKHNDKSFDFTQIFVYEDKEGVTTYSERSSLGKFKKKYGSLPAVGVKMKALTNSEGFLRLKID